MKRFLTVCLRTVLRLYAQAILGRYHPMIIGVTGSVGKTSTKEAIFTVLQTKFRAGKNWKNYNNELGVPLSIIGADTGRRSVMRWFGVLWKATPLLLFRQADYPEVLVLEMGADKPGDLAYLTALAPCKVGVVTAIDAVHTEFFGTIDDVRKEKSTLVTRLPDDGLAVLNADDTRVRSLQDNVRAKVFTYGFADDADVRAFDIRLSAGGDKGTGIGGISFLVAAGGNHAPFFLSGVLGRHQLYAPLAAVAIGVYLGMDLSSIAEALRQFQPPAGRMRLLPGIKGSLLIDDTYNASPISTLAALDTLASVPGYARRVACLGDMAELGRYSDEGHAQVGAHAAELKLDQLVTVGAGGKKIAIAATDAGLSAGHIASFDTADDAGRFVQNHLQHNDLVLIKGSQVVRMETIVKEVMAEPERAAELLVRQGEGWQTR